MYNETDQVKQNFLTKFKNWLFNAFKNFFATKRKRKIVLIVIALAIIFMAVRPKGIDSDLISLVEVKQSDLVSSIKASGQITSIVDLNLSFKVADMVSRVNVSVGQKVKQGQVLATLESANESAAVTQALGGLRSAKATLQKVREGATNEELRVAQTAYDNAVRDYEKTKKTQDSLVENARRTLYSQYLEAIPDVVGVSSSTPTVAGSYSLDNEAVYKLSVYSTGAGFYYSVTGQSTNSGQVDLSVPKPLGIDGLFITFPAGFSASNSSWTINVPNKTSSYYTTNYNAYLAAKQNRELALSQAQAIVDARKADLDLKKAGSRTADIEIAEANVISAEGVYQNALANLEKKILRSPANGTITRVDIKVGEQANALTPVVVLQDVSRLYIESNINESNIKNVVTGQPVSFTVDAFGSSQNFVGVVTEVEPSATITDGIVNYKIKSSINDDNSGLIAGIKPGMNANIIIVTGTKPGVISIPGAAIVKKDGKNFVRVITNAKKKKFIEREVQTGISGNGNMVEIVSGLGIGEYIAIVENKK